MSEQLTEHNHTPWPEYERSLSTGGYSLEFVTETVEALKSTWSCPACTNNAILGSPKDDVASGTRDTTEVAGDIVTDSGGLVVPEHRLNPVEVVVDSHGPSIPQITDYDSLEKAKELLLSLEAQIRVHLSILGPLEENAWALERAITDYEEREADNDI